MVTHSEILLIFLPRSLEELLMGFSPRSYFFCLVFKSLASPGSTYTKEFIRTNAYVIVLAVGLDYIYFLIFCIPLSWFLS